MESISGLKKTGFWICVLCVEKKHLSLIEQIRHEKIQIKYALFLNSLVHNNLVMKSGGILFSILLSFSALLIPAGISYAQEESVGMSDQVTITSNQTSTTEETNLGQQISSFVHDAMTSFKMQREETLGIIKECREKIASAEDRDAARQECKAKLDGIRESYKESRMAFRELFKEKREAMIMVMKDARSQFAEKRTEMHEEMTATRADMMEKMKEQRDAIKEKIKQEREEMASKMKQEKMTMKEEMEARKTIKKAKSSGRY
ncbi:MAG: hypothetical protein ACREBU_07975 [Nitrososphaera sp.]